MTEKAEAELAKLLAECDRAVLDRIDGLVSKTPQEHRKGLREKLRALDGALINLGLDPTCREMQIEQIWEGCWPQWCGRSYRNIKLEAEGAVVSVRALDLWHVANFEPTAACMLSHAVLLDLIADTRSMDHLENVDFHKCAGLHRALAADMVALSEPRPSPATAKESADVKVARQGALRATEEMALRIADYGRSAIVEFVQLDMTAPRPSKADAMVEVLLHTNIGAPMDELQAKAGMSDEELREIRERSERTEWGFTIDGEIARYAEGQHLARFKTYVAKRSSASAEAGIASASARQARSWEEYSLAFWFFAEALRELDLQKDLPEARRISRARKVAGERLRVYAAASGKPTALSSWKLDDATGASAMSKILTREALLVHADRLKSFRLP
jgi:hypothetical protein